jgi:hypothetical protein
VRGETGKPGCSMVSGLQIYDHPPNAPGTFTVHSCRTAKILLSNRPSVNGITPCARVYFGDDSITLNAIHCTVAHVECRSGPAIPPARTVRVRALWRRHMQQFGSPGESFPQGGYRRAPPKPACSRLSSLVPPRRHRGRSLGGHGWNDWYLPISIAHRDVASVTARPPADAR